MSLTGWILTLAFAGLVLMLFMVSQAILTPFVAGLVLAYVLSPLVGCMERRGVPRPLASGLPVALAIILLGLLSAFVLPLLAEQVTNFVQKLPGYLNLLQQELISPKMARIMHLKSVNSDMMVRLLGGVGMDSASWLSANLNRLYSGALALFNIAMLVVMTPLVAFYLMHDWPQLEPRLLRALPRRWRPTVKNIAAQIDQRLSSYLRGQLLVCVLLGTFYAVALELAGLELGWALGLMTGLLAFIPVVGAMIAVTAMMMMALVQYQFNMWEPYALLIGIYAFGQALESSILTPLLVGNKVGLHPVWVIFALLVGGDLMGITGMLLAIPVAVVVSVLIPYFVAAWHDAVT